MNDIVIELTERVKKDYQALPPPIQKKFNSCASWLKTRVTLPFKSTASTEQSTGSSTLMLATGAFFARKAIPSTYWLPVLTR